MGQLRKKSRATIPGIIAIGLLLSLGVPLAHSECYDVRGEIVVEIPDETIRDIAMAGLEGDEVAVIRYNQRVLEWYAPETREWFHAHECAHHVRGHAFGPYTIDFRRIAEQEADCFATEMLMRSGRFSESDLEVVKNDLARMGPGDWIYLPGGRRAMNLDRCAESAPRADIELFIRPLPPTGLKVAAVATIHIDGEEVGTIRNTSRSESSISSADFVEGNHAYYLRVHTMKPVPPFTSRIMERVGRINVRDGGRYRVTGDMDSGELELVRE